MFDHPKNNNDKDEGINFLPGELQQVRHHSPKKDPVSPGLHMPAKDDGKKIIANTQSSHVVGKPKPPKPSFFGRLFKKKLKSPKESSVVAVNEVKIQPPKTTPAAPTNSPVSTYSPPAKIIPSTKVVQVKKEIGGFNEVKSANKNTDEPGLVVNLLPSSPKGFTDTQIIWSYFFIFIISLLVVFSPYIYFESKNKRYNEDINLFKEKLILIDKKITEFESEIKDYGSLSQQFNNLNNVFKNHVYWSQFFPTLENHTAGNVYFTGLSVTDLGGVDLGGKALNLRSMAEELVVLNSSPIYQDVKLTNLTFEKTEQPGDPGVSFSISFIVPHSVIEKVGNADNNTQPQ